MPDQPIHVSHANDRIPLGDLIEAYILHHLIPTSDRDRQWSEDKRLMRASLNHISEVVHDLPGQIQVRQCQIRSNQ